MIIVLCSQPGRIRAGRKHPAQATYDEGTLTANELRSLIADHTMTVVRGELVRPDTIELAAEEGGEPDPAAAVEGAVLAGASAAPSFNPRGRKGR